MDIPGCDKGVGRVEETEEADVVQDFISKEHVHVVGVGLVTREECTDDERGDTDWKRKDVSVEKTSSVRNTDWHRRG